ncbi:hypothetical protein [Gemmata massiliana]|nr:hypothetical protein [Gemmata massiliana]
MKGPPGGRRNAPDGSGRGLWAHVALVSVTRQATSPSLFWAS